LECRGKKTITPSRYYACRRVEVLLVAPNFDSKATLLDADIQWAGNLFSFGTCLKETFDMTCYTEAYFDILFGADAVAELSVPDYASSYNGTSVRNLSIQIPGRVRNGAIR
jgi:hypothetical protein